MEIASRRHRPLRLDDFERKAGRRTRVVEPRRLGEAIALSLLGHQLRPADFVHEEPHGTVRDNSRSRTASAA